MSYSLKLTHKISEISLEMRTYSNCKCVLFKTLFRSWELKISNTQMSKMEKQLSTDTLTCEQIALICLNLQ